MTRKQCKKCPWRTDVNPNTIPNGYCEKKHAALKKTIAKSSGMEDLRVMACHETPVGKEKACVGWLANQLGPGNNLALRLAVFRGKIDSDVLTVGKQHKCFIDTLPVKRK